MAAAPAWCNLSKAPWTPAKRPCSMPSPNRWNSGAWAEVKRMIADPAIDLVIDMTQVKHPFREQGVRAQAGIEF